MRIMKGVREYQEGCPVMIGITDPEGLDQECERVVIQAESNGVYVQIDLEDMIDWINANNKQLLK